jgi:hypothetical protein
MRDQNAVQVYQELTAEVLELKTLLRESERQVRAHWKKNAIQTKSIAELHRAWQSSQAENARLQGIQARMSDKLTELFGELKV